MEGMSISFELRHVDLGDPRLDQRFVKLVEDFARRPGIGIPEACGDWAATKAAYRFMNHPKIDPAALRLASAHDAAAAWPDDGVVLMVQDTTSLDYTAHPSVRGLGPMTPPSRRGFFPHTTLAVGDDGVPFGLLDQRSWVRDDDPARVRKPRRKRDLHEKESKRWVEALAAAEAAAPPDRPIITVADREADIYDVFAAPRRAGHDLIIRIRGNRVVDAPEHLLGAAVEAAPVGGTMVVEIGRGDERPPRTAVLRLKWVALSMAPPVNRRGRARLPHPAVTAVLAEELAAPEGQEPIRWLLATTLAVESAADAERTVRRYSPRWLVERFHYTLKSGFKVEELRLGTAAALDRAATVFSAAAWRVMRLAYEARMRPDRPCADILTPEQAAVLAATVPNRDRSSPPLSLGEAVTAVAKLGGFLARKSDGAPGVKTLWRGLKALDERVEGYRAAVFDICGKLVGNS